MQNKCNILYWLQKKLFFSYAFFFFMSDLYSLNFTRVNREVHFHLFKRRSRISRRMRTDPWHVHAVQGPAALTNELQAHFLSCAPECLMKRDLMWVMRLTSSHCFLMICVCHLCFLALEGKLLVWRFSHRLSYNVNLFSQNRFFLIHVYMHRWWRRFFFFNGIFWWFDDSLKLSGRMHSRSPQLLLE